MPIQRSHARSGRFGKRRRAPAAASRAHRVRERGARPGRRTTTSPCRPATRGPVRSSARSPCAACGAGRRASSTIARVPGTADQARARPRVRQARRGPARVGVLHDVPGPEQRVGASKAGAPPSASGSAVDHAPTGDRRRRRAGAVARRRTVMVSWWARCWSGPAVHHAASSSAPRRLKERSMRRLGIAAVVAGMLCAPSASAGVLRLLHQRRRRRDVQQRDAGRADARRARAPCCRCRTTTRDRPTDFAMVDAGAGRAPGGRREDAAEGGLRARSTRWARRGSSSTGSRIRAAPEREYDDDARRRCAVDGDGARTSGECADGLRRHDRGAVHRRRVRDRDPVGEGLDRASTASCATRSTRSPPAPSRCCGRTSRAG